MFAVTEGEEPPTDGSETFSDDRRLSLELDGDRYELTRDEAARLSDTLAAALTAEREFLRTTGRHREDGSYVVERRGADSAGHRKVFADFAALEGLYDRLPAEFGAEAVGRIGLSGGRRHMVVHHLAEHPAFDCSLAAHQPLTARKEGRDGGKHPD